MTYPRTLTSWAAAALCGLAFGIVGCSLQRSEGDTAAATDQTAAPDAPAPADAATADDAAAAAAADAAMTDGERIDQILARGAEQEAAGALRAAEATYAHALEVDPGNPQATDGLSRVRQTAGIAPPPAPQAEGEPSPAGGVTQEAGERANVRREQLLMEAESRIKQGESAYSAGDFDTAIRAFEDALMIVKWRPELVGGDLTENSIEARIDAAKTAKGERMRQEEIDRQARITREQQEAEDRERARQENKIVILFEAANAAYDDDRYSEAESYLSEILTLDPTNNAAAHLRDLARDARLQATDRTNRSQYKQQWRKTFDDMTASLRPQMELVAFPDTKEWRTISERGPIEFSVQDAIVSPIEKEITDKLRSIPITLSFNDTPLTEAIEWFKTVTGVNFIISPTILAAGDEPKFTINIGPMPAIDALDTLFSLPLTTPLTRRIENGVVRIMTVEEAKGGQILEIYDIRDLAKIIRNFPAKDFNLTPSGFAVDNAAAEGPEPQPNVLEAEKLGELIRTNIAKETWDADPNNTIQPVSGALVVRQNREVHELIRSLLQDLRENAGTLISIESRFLTVSDSFLEDIGVDFRGLGTADVSNPKADVPAGLVLDDFGGIPGGFGTPTAPSGIGTKNDLGIFYTTHEGDIRSRVENLYDASLGNDEFTNSGGLSLQGTFLDDSLVEAVLRAVTKYGTTNIVDAPSLTVFNGQRASMSVINHFSYVKDFDVEIAQAAVIAQPVVDVIQDGVVLDVRPVVSSDKRFITMELRPTVANLKRPLDTFTTSLGIGSDVTIELPTLTVQRAKTTVTMPDGSTLMIGGWKQIEDQDFASGVPFLNKIPVVSFFFDRKGKFLEKKKLLILVRAKIVIPEESEPIYAAR